MSKFLLNDSTWPYITMSYSDGIFRTPEEWCQSIFPIQRQMRQGFDSRQQTCRWFCSETFQDTERLRNGHELPQPSCAPLTFRVTIRPIAATQDREASVDLSNPWCSPRARANDKISAREGRTQIFVGILVFAVATPQTKPSFCARGRENSQQSTVGPPVKSYGSKSAPITLEIFTDAIMRPVLPKLL